MTKNKIFDAKNILPKILKISVLFFDIFVKKYVEILNNLKTEVKSR